MPLPFYRLVSDASTASLGTTSTEIRPQVSARYLLVIHNASASTAIAVNLSGGDAVVNGAGSITLAAGATMYLDTVVPTNKITAIAASGTVPFTCYYMEFIPLT